MRRIELKVKKREVSTKGVLHKLRRSGFIPGIAYDKHAVSVPISVNEKNFMNILRHEGINIVVDLDIEGDTHPTILKELQKDPVKDNILHVDFQEVELNKPVFTKIPIATVGEAKGEKVGGLLEHMLYELEVEATPLDIPDKIDVDVTPLDINDVIYVKNLVLSDKVKVLTSPDAVVVQVGHPVKEEIPVVAAEEVEGEGEEKEEEQKEEKKE